MSHYHVLEQIGTQWPVVAKHIDLYEARLIACRAGEYSNRPVEIRDERTGGVVK